MDLHIPLLTQSWGGASPHRREQGCHNKWTPDGQIPRGKLKARKMPENAVESQIHTLLASRLVKRPYGLPIQQARTLQLAEQYR